MARIRDYAIWLSLAALALGYLAQLPTPLRMNTDGVTYLTLAASFNDGHGFIWHGHKAHFPSGYPAMVAMLERTGLGSSFGLVGWNFICLAISIACGIWLLVRWLGLSHSTARLVVVILLLARGTIRYATIPGSELPYMAVSFLCLVLLWIAENEESNRAWAYWAAALLLAPVAMSIRLIGVVLPPAIVWSLIVMLWRRRPAPQPTLGEWARARKKMLVAAAIIGFVLACGVVWTVSRTSYFKEGEALMAGNGIVAEMLFTLKQRCLEVVSMVSNLRTDRGSHARLLLTTGGGVFVVLILVMLVRRLPRLRGVDVCLIGYVCILMVWPYKEDIRFWLPVQLLVLGLGFREAIDLAGKKSLACTAKVVMGVWIGFFAVNGVLVLVQSTRLTYSGKNFSERYDLFFYRDTYRAALHNGLPVDPEKVNTELLPLLKRFGAKDFK